MDHQSLNPSYAIAKRLVAGIGTLAIVSQEERRVLLTLHNLARRAGAKLVVWRQSRGFSMTVDVGEAGAAMVTDFGEADWGTIVYTVTDAAERTVSGQCGEVVAQFLPTPAPAGGDTDVTGLSAA